MILFVLLLGVIAMIIAPALYAIVGIKVFAIAIALMVIALWFAPKRTRVI
jgi:hypothetical protein